MNICRYRILNYCPQESVPPLAPLLDMPGGESPTCSPARLVRLFAYLPVIVPHRSS